VGDDLRRTIGAEGEELGLREVAPGLLGVEVGGVVRVLDGARRVVRAVAVERADRERLGAERVELAGAVEVGERLPAVVAREARARAGDEDERRRRVRRELEGARRVLERALHVAVEDEAEARALEERERRIAVALGGGAERRQGLVELAVHDEDARRRDLAEDASLVEVARLLELGARAGAAVLPGPEDAAELEVSGDEERLERGRALEVLEREDARGVELGRRSAPEDEPGAGALDEGARRARVLGESPLRRLEARLGGRRVVEARERGDDGRAAL